MSSQSRERRRRTSADTEAAQQQQRRTTSPAPGDKRPGTRTRAERLRGWWRSASRSIRSFSDVDATRRTGRRRRRRERAARSQRDSAMRCDASSGRKTSRFFAPLVQAQRGDPGCAEPAGLARTRARSSRRGAAALRTPALAADQRRLGAPAPRPARRRASCRRSRSRARQSARTRSPALRSAERW